MAKSHRYRALARERHAALLAGTLPEFYAKREAEKANLGIQVAQHGFAKFQQNGGPATQGSGYASAQLRAPDGKVQIGAFRTDPASAENLKVMAPELFVPDEEKAAEAAKVADAAREDEAEREELGRHQDDQLEGYHQHVVGMASPQSLISLMVYGQRGETPLADLLKNIADQMHESLETAIDKVNAVAAGVQRQFTNLAKAMGVNPDAAADWIKDHRKDTAMVASQAHFLRRDVRAWLPLLEDYRAATGDGRARS